MLSQPRRPRREGFPCLEMGVWLALVLVGGWVVSHIALWACPTILRWLISIGAWDTYRFWWEIFVAWGCVIPK
jgi:hypothetical protein